MQCGAVDRKPSARAYGWPSCGPPRPKVYTCTRSHKVVTCTIGIQIQEADSPRICGPDPCPAALGHHRRVMRAAGHRHHLGQMWQFSSLPRTRDAVGVVKWAHRHPSQRPADCTRLHPVQHRPIWPRLLLRRRSRALQRSEDHDPLTRGQGEEEEEEEEEEAPLTMCPGPQASTPH